MNGISPHAARYLGTPSGFARGVLGHSVWDLQREILDSVSHHRRTAVKSCNASGKTFLSADLTLWWVTNFSDGIVVTTAPGWDQVKNVLWSEIRNSARLSTQRGRISYPQVNTTDLRISDKNYAIGISTNESTRFQGFHSGHVLIILDEAPGVRFEIWEAIQGLRAGGNVSLLAIGNPTIIGGPFHDAFTTNREHWHTWTISAFDTPNLAHTSLMFQDQENHNIIAGYGKDIMEMTEEELDHAVRPYLCSRRWVKEQYEDFGGATHPYFQSRVLAEFPSESEDSLIPLSWLERAKYGDAPEKYKDEPLKAGLDVAGPGEAETCLVVRRGPHVVFEKGWVQPDPRGDVVAALGPYKADLVRLNVDSIGIGWNMFTHLRDIFGAERVFPVNVGNEPRDKEKFFNAKAEYYWGLRQRAKDGELHGLSDKAIGQLTAIRYSHNSRGQVVIESKEDLRKRGVKSPDRAEAVMLAYAERVRGEAPKMFSIGSVSRTSSWRNSMSNTGSSEN